MASSPSSRSVATLLTIANLFLPLAIVMFCVGFFPYKPFLPGLAEHDALHNDDTPIAPFDKLVFMVVDALRSDFVFSSQSGFKYTQSLIRDGTAIPFTANARSPTVTMPRLKAMTTGSIPSFVDLILNFDEADTSSTLASQDTWLAQMRAAGKGKLLMFGDDTWLKLFPATFDRSDGTSSFFVSDFTEVDNNVTRNIAPELNEQDWTLMVLHFLGLDHIGHKSGPRSGNMAPKQQEMDSIVQVIYSAIVSKPHLASTLFVLCGDHGMNDAGNHGASSPGETSPALVFISPKLKGITPEFRAPVRPQHEFDFYSTVEQSDITPTIAALLGLPISKNNLGAFIPEFLPFWPTARHQVQILIQNAKQILQIVTATFGAEIFENDSGIDACHLDATNINTLACEWRRLSNKADTIANASELDQVWLFEMIRWLRNAQEMMSSLASNYDVPKLVLGQVLSIVAVVLSGAIMLQYQYEETALPLLGITASYGVMMFASSYVEEEQHFWYWSLTIWFAYLGIKDIRKKGIASGAVANISAFIIIRLMRSWNQTGQKFAGNPDVVKTFVVPNPHILWALIVMSYAMASLQVMANVHRLPYVAKTSIVSVLASSAFAFRLAFTAEDAPELVIGFVKRVNDRIHGPSLISRARVVFVVLLALVVFAVYQARMRGPQATASAKLIHYTFLILAMTQSRATNIPLLLFSSLLFHSLQLRKLTIAEITTTSILLQYASFFAFGGSNAISSVDLSSAYNGVSGYNVIAVGVLTFISNWAGSIFWVFGSNLFLVEKYREGQRDVLGRHLTLLTIFTATSVASVMAACTALRTHLFVWTVFSPKFLYCMAWSLAQHLVINVGLGSMLFMLGTR